MTHTITVLVEVDGGTPLAIGVQEFPEDAEQSAMTVVAALRAVADRIETRKVFAEITGSV